MPKIVSIFFMISGVNFGITSRALRLSMTCSGLLAPRMIVLVFGFLASQAGTSWVVLQPSSVIDVRATETTGNIITGQTAFR